MSIDVRKNSDRATIIINEKSLSDHCADEFKALATGVIDEGILKIDIDLSVTDFIDSSGIGKLLYLNKKLESLSGELRIVKITTTLLDFLDSLSINKVIKVEQ